MVLVLWKLQSSGRNTAEQMIYISINIYINIKHYKMDVNSGDYMGTRGNGGYLHLPGQENLAGSSTYVPF